MVLISTQRLYESFIASGHLNAAIQKSNFFLVFSPDCDPNLEGMNLFNFVSSFEVNFFKRRIDKYLLDYFTLKEAGRNISSQTRIRRFSKIPVNYKLSLFSAIRFKKFRLITLFILKMIPFQSIWEKYLIDLICYNRSVKKIFQKIEATHLLVLSGGTFANYENYFMYYAKKYGIQTGLIVDNWDNLTTKSKFYFHPNLIGVWGKDMYEDAVNFQKMDPKSIRIIGSSRIDRDNTLFKPISSDNCVLFAGSGRKLNDELNLLRLSARTLLEFGHILLYRPHPFYFSRDMELIFNERVNDIENVKLSTKNNLIFYGNESNSLLKAEILRSKFVIANHSTVIVESLYLGKLVVAYTTSSENYLSNSNIWDSYEHLSRLRGNKFIREITELSDFEGVLRSLLMNNSEILDSRNHVPRIIPSFKSSYSHRLKTFIEELLSLG